jgi:hypothetical protein
MKRKKFSINHEDDDLRGLVNETSQKTLAHWAIECTQRVMPYFEEKFPHDHRPQKALETLQGWIKTGVFKMAVIRKASLDSHATAREVGEDSPARSVARAAGQTVATAHVPRHAYGSAIYAQQAIYRASTSDEAEAASKKERDWQFERLVELKKRS